MNVQVGEKVIPVDLVGQLTPEQYISQLLAERPERREVSFSLHVKYTVYHYRCSSGVRPDSQ